MEEESFSKKQVLDTNFFVEMSQSHAVYFTYTYTNFSSTEPYEKNKKKDEKKNEIMKQRRNSLVRKRTHALFSFFLFLSSTQTFIRISLARALVHTLSITIFRTFLWSLTASYFLNNFFFFIFEKINFVLLLIIFFFACRHTNVSNIFQHVNVNKMQKH